MHTLKHSALHFDPQNIKRLFILRPDNLGDLILFSGTLEKIRNHFINAEITICVKKYTQNYIETCPHIDKIVFWEDLISPFSKKMVEFKGRWRIESIYRRLYMRFLSRQNRSYSVFLLPLRYTLNQMHQIASFDASKFKYAIMDTENSTGSEWRDLFDEIYTDALLISSELNVLHEFKIHSDFLNMLGIDTNISDIFPEIWTTEADRTRAQENIVGNSEALKIGLCPGVTSRADKFYSPQNYVEAFDGLRDKSVEIHIFGSPSEDYQCKQTEIQLNSSSLGIPVKNHCGLTTIRELAEAFNLCDLIISNETAALHMATTLKKPTIGITGGGHFGRFYPWGDPTINLTANKMMDCYYCNWNCIYDELRCIHEISPTVIRNQIETLIQ